MEAVLAAGVSGLRYFELYLPRAGAVAARFGYGEGFSAYQDLRARYFEHQGISLDALEADIEIVARVAAELDVQFHEQASATFEVARSWTGPAADRAGEQLGQHLGRADGVRRSAHDVRHALGSAARDLRLAVSRKANWVAGLDPGAAGGLGPDDIDSALSAGDEERLRSHFLPHVRDTVARFDALCDETATVIDDVYRNLACVFARIDDSPFPVPEYVAVQGSSRIPQSESSDGCRSLPGLVEQGSPPPAATPASVVACPPGPARVGTEASALDLGTRPAVAQSAAYPSPAVVSASAAGSLALDGAVVTEVVRAAGAVVGLAAQVALDLAGTVGDLVRETAEVCPEDVGKGRGPDDECDRSAAPGPQPQPQPEPECDTLPAPTAAPAEDPPPAHPPVVEECPAPIPSEPIPPAPPTQAAPPDPVGQPSGAAAEVCVPVSESATGAGSEVDTGAGSDDGSPASHQLLGNRAGSGGSRVALAEAGASTRSEQSGQSGPSERNPHPGDDGDSPPAGVTLAEAGPL